MMIPKALNIDQSTASYLQWALQSPGDINLGAGGLSTGACRALARTPPVAAIIRTRCNQSAEWQRPQEDEFSVGFQITPRDKNQRVTKSLAKEIDEATEKVMAAGADYFPGGLEAWDRATNVDSLTADLAFTEIGEYKKNPKTDTVGELLWFAPADPTYIRRWITSEQIQNRQWFAGDNETAFVQYMDNEITAEWTKHQMHMGIRNPRSWTYTGGYGHPELEELVSIVAWAVHAFATNGSNYMTGMHGNMMLVLKSSMKTNRFEQIERMIHAALSGVASNRKTPVIQVNPAMNEDIIPVELGKTSNADMQYADWINFLVKVICSLYAMDPAEMGFIFGNEGVKNQQYANSPLDRIVNSKERGLRPLLRAKGRWVDEFLFRRFYPRLKFNYVGFDAQTQKERDAADSLAVKEWLTVNEVRASRNRERIEHPAADLPLNNLFQLENSLQAPPIIEVDSVSAWLNGQKQRPRLYTQAA